MAKIELLQPEMKELCKQLAGETAVAIKKFDWDKKHAKRMYDRSVSK